jgi:ABC-type transport system involved in multi-copper enzyme maturation permease subunit
MLSKQATARSGSADPAAMTARVLDSLTDQAKPVVSWMLAAKSDRPDPAATKAADAWAAFLLDERPGMLSAIFLILLFGWPLVVAFGAFDLYAGDIGSRQLRYQLLRADRGSIYAGRLLGNVMTFLAVLILLGATVTIYMGCKLSVYPWASLLAWAAYGTAAMVVVSLPYIALCAWISASTASSFVAMTMTSLVIGGVPLLAMLARMTHEVGGYVQYLLPWGFQMRLFHPDIGQVGLAVLGVSVQTALFTWLGYRAFTRRDL